MEILSLALILKTEPKNKYFFHNYRKEILLLKLRGLNISAIYEFLCKHSDIASPSSSSLYKYLSKYPFTKAEKREGENIIKTGILKNDK